MGDKTGIEWTDATWNPTRGCRRVSPGCEHCYAEAVAGRFCGPGQAYEGLAKRVRLTIAGEQVTRARWTGKGRIVREKLTEPLRWQRPRRIFVNSMSDLFFEEFTNEEIAGIFGIMAAAPRHTFQILTKRHDRLREWSAWFAEQCAEAGDHPRDPDAVGIVLSHAAGEMLGDGSESDTQIEIGRNADEQADAWARIGADGGTEFSTPWPLPNVWIGVSVEDQSAADARIPRLLEFPAAVRFLSCEPLLGPVMLREEWALGRFIECPAEAQSEEDDACRGCTAIPGPECAAKRGPQIDWIIAGCESGAGARPCEVAWLRSIRDQCAEKGVAFFLKQAVEPAPLEQPAALLAGVRHFEAGGAAMDGSHVKRGAGPRVIAAPYLDGVQHLAFPAERAR